MAGSKYKMASPRKDSAGKIKSRAKVVVKKKEGKNKFGGQKK